ncbi:MAG: patatin-like phospholipase family protein, partial [Gammaproteobacteria bacterium]
AGTSMGAIIGGLYASGMTPEQIGNELQTIDWPAVFDDATPRPDRPLQRKLDDENYLVKKKPGFEDGKLKLPPGIIQGQKFELELSRLTLPVAHIDDFDELPIPFRAVATDIETGAKVVLDSGRLDSALRASMAVPGAFAPVSLDGRLLVDGGISDNVPVSVARDMGADVLIVVDLSAELKDSDEINSVLGMLGQLSALLTVRNASRQIATLTPDDIYLKPALRDVGSGSFDKLAERKAIGYGEEVARASTAALLEHAVSPRVYAAYLEERARTPHKEPPVIDFVRFENESSLSEDVLVARLGIETGVPLDVEAIEAGIANLYGLDVFQSVSYEVISEGERNGLLIRALEKPWGPNYIQFGVALGVLFDDQDTWNIGARYLKTNINGLGGEVSLALQIGANPLLLGEWFQPLDSRWRWFSRTRLFAESRPVGLYDNGDRIARYDVRRAGGSVAAGRLFGNDASLAVGLRRFIGDTDLRSGSPLLPESSFNNAEWYVDLIYDTLDNRNFPRHGGRVRAEWSDSLESFGGDGNFSQIEATAAIAHSWGPNTLIGGVEFAETLHGDAPLQNRFQAGGFASLSGFAQNEISGQQLAFIRAAYFRRLGRVKLMPKLFSMYAGFTLEYGNVFEDQGDISFEPSDALLAGSVFLGVDTILAPLYVAYGHAEGGNDAVYVFLGRIF